MILAGGLGTRMREETEYRPKPMVMIGDKPALMHVIENFVNQGFREFIICTGYKGEMVRNYFLTLLSDFSAFRIYTKSGKIEYLDSKAIPDIEVTVVDTGLDTPTGGRVKLIEKYIAEESFIVTYGDGLANVNISQLVESHHNSGVTATVTSHVPKSRFGVIGRSEDGSLTSFSEKPPGNEEVSIGFFVFNRKIFQELSHDSVLETKPLEDAAMRGELAAYRHDGFFLPMDTHKEVEMLRDMWSSGHRPWILSV